MSRMTYKDAGVDTVAKDRFIDKLFGMMRRTYNPRVIENDWGYAGFFALNGGASLFKKQYKDPVLVGCADGVGTKLKIAQKMGKHDTVGIDLVAMCVNDMIVSGAEPLFFLDYIAVGPLDEVMMLDVMKGLVRGCEMADCALLGGETAQHPGQYGAGEYEMGGFCTGVVDRERIIDGKSVQVGDTVIGVASSGLHSNGYTLVRKILFEQAGLKLTDKIEGLRGTLGEELLTPTRIYVRPMKHVLAPYRTKKVVKAIAHITGGGIVENVPRVLPPDVDVEIRIGAIPVPPIFKFVQEKGGIPDGEMVRVFNMGLGLVVIVDPYYAKAVVRRFQEAGEVATIVGTVTKGKREVNVKWV
ncbi:MAG: phosphoribosylformylglycinamidine cyclo-ligase [Planctomycetes bacterium]|nr:phosphoribosylformylglycinamidine cyclo-ligase [Planctomycetota bacterium]